MSSAGLDIDANRSAAKWTYAELAGRILWRLISPLFAWSPRPFWGWRRFLVRAFGGTVGRKVQIHPSARISIPWNLSLGDHTAIGDRAVIYALGPIAIGQRVTISQHAHLCAGTHDHRRPDMALLKLPITIGDDAWICADAFVGPGVSIGQRAIVAARGVAVKNVPADTIVGGNPARKIKLRPKLA
jgi:putative colanic acid biosynthesis acetyltransferase WcaF